MRELLACAASMVLLTNPFPAAAAVHSAAPATMTSLHIDKSRIDRMLHQMVATGRVVGAMALVWKDGHEAYFGSAGYADREAGKPMRRDTLIQVWSMTKPITGTALLGLWEQGRFGIDEPLAKYLPEYAGVKVFKGLDAAGKPILKVPDRPILIRDILRHTAGFSYGPGDTYSEKVFAKVDPLNLNNDLAAFSRRNATVPLLYEPGTQWRYSDAVDVQARLVEVLTGMKFEDYVRGQVLEPLGMRETAWTQPQSRLPRLAAGYTVGPDKKLVRKSDVDIRRLNFSDRKLTMGGAGVATTIDDYMRFARMLLNRGTLDGVRILKPSTVRMMSTNELDPKITERQWLGSKGSGGFGMDVFVRTSQPKDASENRGAVGEFFWDGAWSTLFWVDPANNLAAVFLVQKDPFDGTLHHDIRRAVYGDDYLGPKGD